MEPEKYEQLLKSTDPELICRTARELLHPQDASGVEKNQACNLFLRAEKLGYPEGAFWVGYLLLRGDLVIEGKISREAGWKRIHEASNEGSSTARGYLNRYVSEIRRRRSAAAHPSDRGPLKDFDGSVIKIDRTGIFTPVDAVLSYDPVDGNILSLSTNLLFLTADEDSITDYPKYKETVIKGIKAWEGTYSVFGGQKLKVSFGITTEERLIDSVLINSVSAELNSSFADFIDKYGTDKMKKNSQATFKDKRSGTTVSKNWRVTSPKQIIMEDEFGKFDDYNEIFHVAKHEFGHVLGLGDLYYSDYDGLDGVEKGTFPELDPYCLYGKMYYSVMCDHHGPVTDNDIEMMVLAFSENRWQTFQPDEHSEKISRALGKGD